MSLSQGPTLPLTAADVTGSSAFYALAWTNPNNIKADDSTYATVALTGPWYSHYLCGTNYAFTIPAGSTIDGILLSVKRYQTAYVSSSLRDSEVRIFKSTSALTGSSNYFSASVWETSSAQWHDYGGPTDKWGLTWTPTEINNSSFGSTVTVTCQTGQGTANVDAMEITIYYTSGDVVLPNGGSSSKNSAILWAFV